MARDRPRRPGQAGGVLADPIAEESLYPPSSRLRSELSWTSGLFGLLLATAVAQAVAGVAAPALRVVGGALVVCGAAVALVVVLVGRQSG